MSKESYLIEYGWKKIENNLWVHEEHLTKTFGNITAFTLDRAYQIELEAQSINLKICCNCFYYKKLYEIDDYLDDYLVGYECQHKLSINIVNGERLECHIMREHLCGLEATYFKEKK